MIYLIYGKDTFRSKQKLQEIIERYRKIHKSGLNLRLLDLKEKSFEDLKNEAKSVSMFEEKKLIILKNAQANNEFKKVFLKELQKFSLAKEIILFFEEGEVSGDRFFQEIKKNSKFQEFKPLEGYDLFRWIEEQFRNYGTKIEKGAIEKLIEFIGNDLWQMENEIQKLVSYKKRKEITQRDIESLVVPRIETNIFQTIDAIAEKNKKRALKLLKNHLEKGENVFFLFSMIKYEFRNILMVKDLLERKVPILTLKRKTNLHPFVIEKCLKLAQKFSLEDLKKIYQKIFEIDLNIKTGKIPPAIALDLFVAGI